jgi:hypothetical protein
MFGWVSKALVVREYTNTIPNLNNFLDYYLQGSIPSLYSLVREILHDKKQEDIPFVRVIAYP